MLAWCSWFLILKSQRYTEHWPTEMTDRLSHIVCQFIGHFPVHHFWIITLIFFHFWSFKWRKSWFFFKWILILNYLSVFKDCMKGCLCFFLNQVRIRWPCFFCLPWICLYTAVSWQPSKVTASPLEIDAQSTWSCCYNRWRH